MDPQRISAAVRMQPRFQWKVGDRRVTPQGTLLDGHREAGYWTSELVTIDKESLTETLERYLSKLADAKAFIADFCSTGGSVEFFVGWFVGTNSGEVLHWSLMRRLAELQISLAVDAYGDENVNRKTRDGDPNSDICG